MASMRTDRAWLPLLLALASGGLLFLSDHPVHLWPLQVVALVPLLLALLRWSASSTVAAACGLALGAGYTIPLTVVLQLPPLMAAALAVYLTLLWMVFAAAARLLLRWPAPWSGLAVGALAAGLAWVNVSALSIWGTAQSFVRVWSALPFAIQFVAFTGITGLVFVIVAAQALGVRAALSRGRERVVAAAALACLLAVVAAADLWLWTQDPVATIRVAAIGWTWDELERRGAATTEQRISEFFEPALAEAAGKGARLLVSPETGFRLSDDQRQDALQRFAALARRHGVHLAVGYFDSGRNDNRIVFIDHQGRIRGEYRKTHLIPGIESYEPGDGALVGVPLDELRLGGMICQDDNFTDLARGYGRQRAQILALPTNDWEQIKDHHFENSLFRPIENRYAVVRAASDGISAIVSPRGEVLARRDHIEQGAGVIVADVAVGEGGSLYAAAGDWFAAACACALLVGIALGVLRRRS